MVSDIKDRAPNLQAIQTLEKLLEYAKSGELRTIVVLAGWDNDAFNHHWSMDPRNSRRRLVGEMTMLWHDVVTNQSIADGDSSLALAISDD